MDVFDYIKIIENAQEIHLLDSVWGTLIYQLDAKYNLFKKYNENTRQIGLKLVEKHCIKKAKK